VRDAAAGDARLDAVREEERFTRALVGVSRPAQLIRVRGFSRVVQNRTGPNVRLVDLDPERVHFPYERFGGLGDEQAVRYEPGRGAERAEQLERILHAREG
jgi:hypothetical protein